mmetsp:Transcript_21082/g.70239  ORF Transcript_21082/g.70239 Transcript_21082/m.70239 type:complete len:401 (-) Transcript_21082:336-1538(-)
MKEGNVALSFGLVLAAGMCTSLGAAVAFVVNVENKTFLAISLALSAGIMTYVSMVEIFTKSVVAFSDEWCPQRGANEICSKGYGSATAFFFAGLVLCAAINVVTSRKFVAMAVHTMKNLCSSAKPDSSTNVENELRNDCMSGMEEIQVTTTDDANEGDPDTWPEDVCSLPPGWEVRISRATLKHFYVHVPTGTRTSTVPLTQPLTPEMSRTDEDLSETLMVDHSQGRCDKDQEEESLSRRRHPDPAALLELQSTGILAGLAVAIHNFPEGLATFVATMADSSVGVTICVAIAIHNIPEGICVAMPIYHATKSRLKGFIWATISGLSEPLGAVVGYLAVKDNINNVSYGAMFALVAGMMVFISLAELLPSAYRHDVNHAIVTSSWVLGMLIMALSLVAFNL